MVGELKTLSRRALLKRSRDGLLLGLALPPLYSSLSGSRNSSAAWAAPASGVDAGGEVLHIAAGEARTRTIAEWSAQPPKLGQFRIVTVGSGQADIPSDASRYEARSYGFQCGSLRVLTYRTGSPVFHLITFETEIYVLRGTVNLSPLPGRSGDVVRLGVGDALYLPSGMLSNAWTTEETVLLQVFANAPKQNVKSQVVHRQAAGRKLTAHRRDASGNSIPAATPEETHNAPKEAEVVESDTYSFDGNSIRVVTLREGGRTHQVVNDRSHSLVYVIEGRMRTTQGQEIFEVEAGDAILVKRTYPHDWEALNGRAVFLATDAPSRSTGIARFVGGVQSQGRQSSTG